MQRYAYHIATFHEREALFCFHCGKWTISPELIARRACAICARGGAEAALPVHVRDTEAARLLLPWGEKR